MNRQGTPTVGADIASHEPRFLADSMLGRLARWLRILGCDTQYFRDIPDDDLVRLQRQSGRTLLTRDRALARRRDTGPVVFVEHNGWEDQVRQVLRLCGIPASPERYFSLCLRCNERLIVMARAEVPGRVPDFVAATQETFRRCPACRRIYWPGTHRDEMSKRIENLFPPGETSRQRL